MARQAGCGRKKAALAKARYDKSGENRAEIPGRTDSETVTVQYRPIWLSNVELTTSRGDIERTGWPLGFLLHAKTIPLPPFPYAGLTYGKETDNKDAGQS